MPSDLPPLHHHLRFLSPLSQPRADSLVRFLADHAGDTVVDIGCGWAELLIQLLQAQPQVHGLGIDLNDGGFAHARQRATDAGVAGRLQLIAGDAKQQLPSQVQGAICIGATQVWGPAVETHQPLAYRAALDALRRLVPAGAPVVYGEGVWQTPPTEAAVAPLAGRLDEFVLLPELVDLAWEAGFAVVQVQVATQDEWDQFESGYTARWAAWLASNPPSHADYAAVMARARRQHQAYLGGYRGVLGMAYLSLLAI